MTLPMENNTELFLDTLNIRAVQADRMSVGTLSMAGGGLWFLLLRFLYFITQVVINFVFSMNLFRVVQFESIQRGQLNRHPLCRARGAQKSVFIASTI
jgi:hypothetical protein